MELHFALNKKRLGVLFVLLWTSVWLAGNGTGQIHSDLSGKGEDWDRFLVLEWRLDFGFPFTFYKRAAPIPRDLVSNDCWLPVSQVRNFDFCRVAGNILVLIIGGVALNMASTRIQAPRLRVSRPRFSLTSLLLFIFALCIVISHVAVPMRSIALENRLLAEFDAVERQEGDALTAPSRSTQATRRLGGWTMARTIMPRDWFYFLDNVITVSIPGSEIQAASSFPYLKFLSVEGDMSQASAAHISDAGKLEILDVRGVYPIEYSQVVINGMSRPKIDLPSHPTEAWSADCGFFISRP